MNPCATSSCEVPGCERPARGRYCELHWSRHRRGKALESPVPRTSPASLDQDAADALLRLAAIAYADAPEDLKPRALAELLRAADLRAAVLARGQDDPADQSRVRGCAT